VKKILGGQHRVQFGTTTIDYELVFSKRKTFAVHVYPDCSVVVDAPLDTSLSEVEQRVHHRSAWILRQQRQFQQSPAAKVALPRRYVSGEAYRYLGRQYRLKVVQSIVERVVLSRGQLLVSVQDTTDKTRIAELLAGWYRGRARHVFNERLRACFPRVEPLGVSLPDFTIREMKTRWGSCSGAGRVTLNPRLIQVSKDLIDYVILHELCHLKEHNHSPAFYALLDRVLPDWRERRQRLNQAEVMK
jgi:predicted metal-dependent hydrolase